MSTAGYSQNISTNFSEQTPIEQTIRIIFIVAYFLIFFIGRIGNVLVFVIMQRGSLKHSSICFLHGNVGSCGFMWVLNIHIFSEDILYIRKGWLGTMGISYVNRDNN